VGGASCSAHTAKSFHESVENWKGHADVTTQAKRILLIDDDPHMHDAVRLILEPEGYEIAAMLTGPEGLATLRRERFDLVLLDIMLSSPLEGFHLMDDIKMDSELKDVPIIMISAIGQTMGLDYAQEMGVDFLRADRFLEKPIDAKDLRVAVNEVLQARSQPS
jgi:CheY-like chemotaxis protein